MKRLLLASLLVVAATLQSGCSTMCTQVARDWGVEGCGETDELNHAPKLRNYRQSDIFPEVGRQVFFDAWADDVDGDALTIEWDFEGDGHVDQTESYDAWPPGASGTRMSDTLYVFRGPAIARLLVRASDFPDLGGGVGEDTIRRRFRVHTREEYRRDRPPVASFNIGAQDALQFSVGRFDASASYDPDGDALYYGWARMADDRRHDESGLLTSPIFNPILDDVGRNEWRLNVYDDFGKSDGTTRFVEILEAPQPPSSIGIGIDPRRVMVNQPVTFTARASDPNNDIVRYEWDIDPDEPGYERVTDVPSTSTTYTTTGDKSVRLRIVDSTEQSLSAGVGFEVFDEDGPENPTAQLTVDPNPALTGQTVTFSAVGSDGAGSEITRYDWDLDGEGDDYEVSTREPYVTRSYLDPGDYPIRLRVVNFHARVGRADTNLRVDPAPGGTGPTARLDVTPNPATQGQTVGFDASGSTGGVVAWEWDVDGAPGYEVAPSNTPYIERTYVENRTFDVRVRVYDNFGRTDEATETLQIGSGSNGATLRAAGRKRARRGPRAFSATLTGDARGRLKARLADAPKLTGAERAFKRFLGASWRARPRIAVSHRDRRARVSAVALASRGRDRACVRVDVDLRAGELPRGTFKVLGGTGTGAKLRGSASFRFQVPRGKPAAILGHLRATRGRPRGLPAACRRLARR